MWYQKDTSVEVNDTVEMGGDSTVAVVPKLLPSANRNFPAAVPVVLSKSGPVNAVLGRPGPVFQK
jgi:hypothetical protein